MILREVVSRHQTHILYVSIALLGDTFDVQVTASVISLCLWELVAYSNALEIEL